MSIQYILRFLYAYGSTEQMRQPGLRPATCHSADVAYITDKFKVSWAQSKNFIDKSCIRYTKIIKFNPNITLNSNAEILSFSLFISKTLN